MRPSFKYYKNTSVKYKDDHVRIQNSTLHEHTVSITYLNFNAAFKISVAPDQLASTGRVFYRF